MMKARYLLLSIPFLISCYGIRTVKVFSYDGMLHNKHNAPAIPDSLKKYFTSNEIQEFNKGANLFFEDNSVQYRNYYIIEGGKKRIESEGYFYTDAPVGSGKDYHSNGKVAIEWNYILWNDSLKKTIDVQELNRICKKKGMNGYFQYAQGEWKYYSEEGKLLKVETYNKGTLVNTTDKQK